MHQIHTKYTKEFKCYVINQQWKKYMNEYMYGQGIGRMYTRTDSWLGGCYYYLQCCAHNVRIVIIQEYNQSR